MTEWISVNDRLPPQYQVVQTKIDTADGVHNVQPLKRVGGLWFFEDGSMYVYYTPTHWMDISEVDT